MFFQSDGGEHILQYLTVLTAFLVILFLCCILQCYICQRFRRRRGRYNGPFDYPSSTLQFVRFNYGKREPKLSATLFENPYNQNQK
ncbi:hypothetical protein V3C99_000714 [Haemonchus contortus]|nr:unnamed protein product [Haemonchus contortus]